MTCIRCGKDIEFDSTYCRFCGATVAPPIPGARRLARRPADGRIAGVCAGVAEYFGIDVTLVRFAFVILSIVPGAVIGGVIAYLLAWLVMPEASGVAVPPVGARRLMRSTADRKIAGVCGGIADFLGVDATAVRLLWAVLTIIPGAIVCGVAAYLVAWFVMPAGPAPQPHPLPTTA
jgi:phage shock protein C